MTNLARTLRQIKANNIWVYGLAVDAPQPYWDADLSGPLTLVVGSERSGLYCAVSILLERLRAEGRADVFQTVKTLQAQRRHLIPGLVSVCVQHVDFRPEFCIFSRNTNSVTNPLSIIWNLSDNLLRLLVWDNSLLAYTKHNAMIIRSDF